MKKDYPSFYTEAQLYDLFERPFADGNFLNFYKTQIERYGEPVLELGCGTGRLTIPLVKLGFQLKGLDISPEMLALAKEKADAGNVKLDLIKGDMTDFDLGEKFKFIFIPAQSLSHLSDVSEVEKCFECVKNHLDDDGRFLIELFNPSLEILNREAGKLYPQSNPGDIAVFSRSYYESSTQINHIELFFRENDKETILSLPMRQYYPLEIDMLLKYNGFQIEHKYGKHDETIFDADSPKQLIICRKTRKLQ
jgi:SAM-dependent methyltransferase